MRSEALVRTVIGALGSCFGVAAALLLLLGSVYGCRTLRGGEPPELSLDFDGDAVPVGVTIVGAADLRVSGGALEVRGPGGLRWAVPRSGIVCTRLLDLDLSASRVGNYFRLRWIALDDAGAEFDAAQVDLVHVAASVTARGHVFKDGRRVEFEETFNDLEPSDVARQRIDYVRREGKLFFFVELIDRSGRLRLVGPIDPDVPRVIGIVLESDLPRWSVGRITADVVHREDDQDGDGLENPFDVCPGTPDPGQEDTDGDGIGDACDPCASVRLSAAETIERLPERLPALLERLRARGETSRPEEPPCDPLPPIPSFDALTDGTVVTGRLVVQARDLLPAILQTPQDFDLPFEPVAVPVRSGVRTTVLEAMGPDGVFQEVDRRFGVGLDDSVELVWDTDDLAPGTYRLRLSMLDGTRNVAWTEIEVVVDRRPLARVRFEVLGLEDDRVRLRLDASDSSDPDGRIESYLWTLPGGEVIEGPVVEVETRFPPDGLPFSLTVADGLGASDVLSGLAVFREEGPKGVPTVELAPDFCECVEMDIRDADDAGLNLMFDATRRRLDAGATARSLGPNVHRRADGSFDRFRMNFEVFARLKAGSKHALCPERQRTSASILFGGVEYVAAEVGTDGDGDAYGVPRPTATTANDKRFPFDPNRLIQDGSHGYKREFSIGASKYKEHGTGATGDPEIRWIDPPGVSNIPATDIDGGPNDGFRLEAAFEATVERCRCTWQVEMEVDRNGTVTRQPRVREELCVF